MRCLVTFALIIGAAGCNSVIREGHHGPDARTSDGHVVNSLDGGGNVDPDGGPPPDTAPPMTPTIFLNAWDHKVCDAAYACKNNFPNNLGYTFAQAYGNNATDCFAIMTAYDMPMSVEQEVTNGQIHWNATNASACVPTLGYQCNNFFQQGLTMQTVCSQVLVGTVNNGGGCIDDWQCANWTSYCDQNTRKCTAG